jgi:hypothetical protein
MENQNHLNGTADSENQFHDSPDNGWKWRVGIS